MKNVLKKSQLQIKIILILCVFIISFNIVACNMESKQPSHSVTSETPKISIIPISKPVLIWEGELEGDCKTVIINYRGEAAFGPCGGPYSTGNVFSAPIITSIEQLNYFLNNYSSFQTDTLSERIFFEGNGDKVATPFEERALTEWASTIYQELLCGKSEDTWWLAIALNQEGGNPCNMISIRRYGLVTSNECDKYIKPYSDIWLTTEQLEKLYSYIDKFQNFEIHTSDDGKPLRFVFLGLGEQVPADDEKGEIFVWVNELYLSLTERASNEKYFLSLLNDFFNVVKEGNEYKFFSTSTKEIVGTEEEYKNGTKVDWYFIIAESHSGWENVKIYNIKIDGDTAIVTIIGDREAEGIKYENDMVELKFIKENDEWKIVFLVETD